MQKKPPLKKALKEFKPITPFIKWAGGKRWAADLLVDLLGESYGRHIEPFVGSGACFFKSTSKKAILGDINTELINCYKVTKNSPDQLIKKLSLLSINKKTFLKIRRTIPSCDINRAVRFLYLNRTAFNGIYRVNKMGQFNVPYGCKPSTKICNAKVILDCSARLKNSLLCNSDFDYVLSKVKDGDRFFIDPPYTVKHSNNGFRRYNENLFSWRDQERLAKRVIELSRQGFRIVVTNAIHKEISALYPKRYFRSFPISRQSNMAALNVFRGIFKEQIIISKAIEMDKDLLKYISNKYYL